MNTVTQFINEILFIITIAIIGLEGVLSILHRIGFLPSFLRKAYLSHDKELVAETTREMGLPEVKPYLRQAVDYWRSENLATIIDAERELGELIIQTTRPLSTTDVGLYRKVSLQYYIDLADYASEWKTLEPLVSLMCTNIRKTLAALDTSIQIDKIAAPPGNPALAIFTASQFQKPFISVSPISPLSSDPISGKVEKNEQIIRNRSGGSGCGKQRGRRHTTIGRVAGIREEVEHVTLLLTQRRYRGHNPFHELATSFALSAKG